MIEEIDITEETWNMVLLISSSDVRHLALFQCLFCLCQNPGSIYFVLIDFISVLILLRIQVLEYCYIVKNFQDNSLEFTFLKAVPFCQGALLGTAVTPSTDF